MYVFELMLIEKDARRHILSAIEVEREIRRLEMQERLKGNVVIRSSEYNQLRRRFVEVCGQINSVANIQGKGRDDLGVEILQAAEEASRKVSNLKSRAVRRLAEQIKSTFASMRGLFRKYAENIEVVDPQLKNNADLAEALLAFERAWEKGKDFLLSRETCATLISFSQMIEGLTEKHRELQEKLDAMDSDVFITIPCLAILKSLDDSDISIYSTYYPAAAADLRVGATHEKEGLDSLMKEYHGLRQKTDSYALYNVMEKAILEKPVEERTLTELRLPREEINKMVHAIKRLAILLQRGKPTDWNALMETAMGIV